ncbi:hypothetical protein GGF31_007101 [Allomyces arbusculus]|nr:hypothetical protein GGF31_007101 [Allomyces arbusculus]
MAAPLRRRPTRTRRLAAAAILATLGLAVTQTTAIPFLHTINDYDAQGHACPIAPFLDQQCPQLCAVSVDKCPTGFRPSCPDDAEYCPDGTCQPKGTQCAAAGDAVCACSASLDADWTAKYKSWVPCTPAAAANLTDPTSFVTVNLTGVRAADKADALVKQCTSTLSNADESQIAFLQCPAAPAAQFTFTEPIWISFWVMASLQIVSLISFAAFKLLTERAVEHKRQQNVDAALAASMDSPLKDSATDLKTSATATGVRLPLRPATAAEKQLLEEFRRDEFFDAAALKDVDAVHHVGANGRKLQPGDPGYLHFDYYVDHPFGAAAFYVSLAFTLYLQVYLGLNVSDYYSSLYTGHIYFFVSDALIASSFVGVWHIMVLTLIIWRLGGVVSVRAWFRIRVQDVADAQYVVVTRKVEAIQATDFSESGIVKKMLSVVHASERLADKYLKLSLVVSAHRVLRSPHIGVPYFYYNCIRYVYSPIAATFHPYPYSIGTTVASYAALATATEAKGGLPADESAKRMDLVGRNEIDIPARSFWDLWTEEMGGWFYLYQGSCLWVWYWFAYWQMGVVLTIVILIASLIKTRVRYISHKRIRMLATMSTTVKVMRNGAWAIVDSGDLVPGDLVALVPGKVAVDLVLCQGQAVLDESSLTGESRPIRKFAVPDNDQATLSMVHHKRHLLLAGTSVMQADEGAYGLVLKTNINTSRGQLIQKMLHPQPIKFVFDEQLKVVLMCMLAWGVVCFCLVFYEMGVNSISSWFYALFIISEVISPLLPAVLVAGQSVAADRLVKKHQVFCIDLPRITMSGKTQVFCFDKTGTLTKEGLDMWGFLPATARVPDVVENVAMEAPLQADVATLDPLVRIGLATSHSLTAHESQLLGNPVDVAMFEFTGCALEGDDVAAPTGETVARIVRRYEFVHSRQTMAVVVEDVKNATSTHGAYRAYVKGSYEKIRDRCTPASVPAWYDQVARGYAKRGGYVLALATKTLPNATPRDAIAVLDREIVESDLTLVGLVVFRNTLKTDTKDAIEELQRGLCRTVMITGDNVFTGIYIARECGLSPSHGYEKPARCVYADMEDGQLVWRDVDSEDKLSADDVQALFDRRNVEALDLAASGAAWAELSKTGLADKYLLAFRVWGRMAPEQKIDVVKRHMDAGLIVAMCGDGGNDCGALNAAHVGIALSEAEASIVAPFSSKTKSVQSCVNLVAEGRAALASSFAGFKFLVMYGMTMSAQALTMYYFSVVLPQNIWIMIDGVIVVSSIYALTQAKALSHLEPRRPTAQLLGPQTVISILTHTAINWTFLFCGIYMLFQQSWFLCNEFDASSIDAGKWWLLGDNYESTIIASIVVPQFINNAAVYNYGHLFRRSWFSNYVYVVVYLGLMSTISVIILTGPNAFTCMFRINCGSPSVLESLGYPTPTWKMDAYNSILGHNLMPQWFRWQLWAYAASNVVLCLLVERFAILGSVNTWVRTKWPLKRKAIHV